MSSKPYKDLMYARLIKYKKLFKVFICLRCPKIPEHIEKLKKVALQSDDKNLIGVYHKEGHRWLKPYADKFIKNLNQEILGNGKTKSKRELFSVYTIETKNENGTIPDPRGFNNEVQHLGKREGFRYPKDVCTRNTII